MACVTNLHNPFSPPSLGICLIESLLLLLFLRQIYLYQSISLPLICCTALSNPSVVILSFSNTLKVCTTKLMCKTRIPSTWALKNMKCHCVQKQDLPCDPAYQGPDTHLLPFDRCMSQVFLFHILRSHSSPYSTDCSTIFRRTLRVSTLCPSSACSSTRTAHREGVHSPPPPMPTTALHIPGHQPH